MSNLKLDTALLQWLCCPFCGGRFDAFHPIKDQTEYGVLNCYCGQYPVVAGIPVLKRDPVLDRIIGLIKAGRFREATVTMLSPGSPALSPSWLRAIPSNKASRWLKQLAHERALGQWQERAADLLIDRRDRVSSQEVFDFYFQKKKGTYDYFAFRTTQPRYLVALSFATLIRQPERPVLDLACGCGHLTAKLVERAADQPVMGIDESFFSLYVAKHWIAPKAHYACCSADAPLPFQNGTFSTTFCSDAFHYFTQKAAVARDLERLTLPDGMIILTWVHNALWRCSHDGLPLSPEGYEHLFMHIRHRMIADTEVLDRYLKRQGPSLECSSTTEQLEQAPLLSIVASHRQSIFKDYGSFEEWPHGNGNLKLNPLLDTEQLENGDVRLRRRFPSAFYEEEHKQCRNYVPEELTISLETYNHLVSGQRTSHTVQLVGQFVAIGTPER